MSKLVYFAGILLCFGLYGQTIDSNSITVPVSHSTTLPADQAQISVVVTSGMDADLTTITAGLSAAGVSALTFGDVSSEYDTYVSNPSASVIASALAWQFTLSVPYAKLHDHRQVPAVSI